MQRFIVLDLDNCIADDEWRLPSIRWDEADVMKRFDTYHKQAGNDHLANSHLFISREHPVLIVTGRPIRDWALTVRWLQWHRVPYIGLYMRPNEDGGLTAPELKRRLLYRAFEAFSIGSDHIVCAYDDRRDVIEMYHAEGVHAEQVYIHERPEVHHVISR